MVIAASQLSTTSWYQRVTLTLTNLYSHSIDLNQLKLSLPPAGIPILTARSAVLCSAISP
jgi:hypothetical protein